jgi:hypothetical protein
MSDQELKNRLTSFMETFELVFEHDWDFSKGCLTDEMQKHFIVEKGTFLSPEIGDESDESNNWANRGALLHEYRQLVEAMKAQNIYRSVAE